MLQLCILTGDYTIPVIWGFGIGNQKKWEILSTEVLDGSMHEGSLQKYIVIHTQLHIRICHIKIIESENHRMVWIRRDL